MRSYGPWGTREGKKGAKKKNAPEGAPLQMQDLEPSLALGRQIS